MAVDGDRFPARIGRGAKCSIERKVEVVTLVDGREERNAAWRGSRRSFDVGFAIRTPADLAEVIAFHEHREGRLTAFRFKDWLDFRSGSPVEAPAGTDQAIGTGDGATFAFQLVKRYGDASGEWIRTIEAPVAGSVLVALDGVDQVSGWSVDVASGVVTFDVAPGVGVAVSAGFEFDVPVRFDTDLLRERREFEELGSISAVPLIEVRPGDTVALGGSAAPAPPPPEVLADMWFSGQRSNSTQENPLTGFVTRTDTEGAFNGGGGVFTVPAAGDWFHSCCGHTTDGAILDKYFQMVPKVDGVDVVPDFNGRVDAFSTMMLGGLSAGSYVANQELSYRTNSQGYDSSFQGMRVRASCRWHLTKGQATGAASGKIGEFVTRLDSLGIYDAVNERLVAPARGWYFIGLAGSRDPYLRTEEGFDIYRNGVAVRSYRTVPNSNRESSGPVCSFTLLFLEAGDALELYQVNGARFAINYAGFNVPEASVELEAGLAVVGDPANAVITGMETSRDRNNNYDAVAGQYTFDRSGDYLVWCQGRPLFGTGTGRLRLRRNGVEFANATSGNTTLQGSFSIWSSVAQIQTFSAGDTCDVFQVGRVWQDVSHGIIFLGGGA